MIRRATLQDINEVVKGYNEIFLHEKKYGAFTVWEQGIYPTIDTAEKSLAEDSLFVMDMDGDISSSMILNKKQPAEYFNIKWPNYVSQDAVFVIHLLCVNPSKSGLGLGKQMVRFAFEEAKRKNAKVVRLDTGAQNKPAKALYTKLGFTVAGSSKMSIGGLIEHEGHLFFEYRL